MNELLRLGTIDLVKWPGSRPASFFSTGKRFQPG